MGLAALFTGVLILLAVIATVLYGTYVGIVRGGALVWRFLLGETEGREVIYSSNGTPSTPCWEDENCPPAAREACPAYAHWDEELPCWLATLRNEGRLRLGCLTCNRLKVADVVA